MEKKRKNDNTFFVKYFSAITWGRLKYFTCDK